ncbi:MAG: Rpn family recombination-promoting nuclease/putative transposase [Rhodoferax sp.]|nr:Rpn family recombination-promoting nuclease/putative transposase [Rhodoferax sp.]
MKFLDVRTDFAFKKVFGSEGSKAILLSFLNAFDFFDGRHTITDLNIIDPYQAPKILGMKDSYVNVKAKLDNGASVIIEMQILNMPGMEQRVLYNAAKAYSTQLLKGEAYDLLNPVIALTITDFVMFDDSPIYKNAFRLLEKERLTVYGGDIELVFIELPKFKKEEEDLTSITDRWLYFIKNAGSLASVPATLGESPELTQAFEIANQAGLSPEEEEAQHRRLDFIALQRGSIELAKRQGREQAQLEIAQRLLATGMTPQQAANITGVAIERLR